MENRPFMADADQLVDQIKRGAFLTVAAEDAVNTMTIGWATMGFVWKKPVFMVAVRDSRHTFTLLEKTDNFTVSIPTEKNWNKALAFCGTQSGRNVDKFKECSLQTVPAQKVASPILGLTGVHYECRIIFKAPMDRTLLDPELQDLYPEKDYHTLYFGEIVSCYTTK